MVAWNDGWPIALSLAIAVGLGIAAEAVLRSRRGRSRTIGLMGLSAAVWAAAELALAEATSAREVLVARRALFAAVCAIGPLLCWEALELSGRAVRRIGHPLVIGAAALEAACYALLFTPRADLFISGTPGSQTYGPAFYVHGAVAWATLIAGTVLIAAAAWRTRGSGRWAAAAAVAGVGTPLALNWIYVATGWPGNDPTPIAVALAGIALRSGAVELLGSDFLAAHARSLVLDQVPAGVFVADGHGRVLECNAAAASLTGGPAIGAQLDAVLAPFAGDPGYFVHAFPIVRAGARIGDGAVLMDRREARSLQKQVEVENHLRALGIVAHGLAHEINNPLASVVGNAEVLRMRVDALPPSALRVEALELVREIEDGAERIRGVVSRMARLSTPLRDLGANGVADVRRVVELAATLARLGKPARILALPEASAARARGRSSELLEILFHLLQNAVQASPESAPVEVRIDEEGEAVVVRVLDRGPGLPADVAEIFSPFYTTERPGRLGLGLSLSWELARKNGGRLEAESRAGGGAEFRLRLQRAREAAPAGAGTA